MDSIRPVAERGEGRNVKCEDATLKTCPWGRIFTFHILAGGTLSSGDVRFSSWLHCAGPGCGPLPALGGTEGEPEHGGIALGWTQLDLSPGGAKEEM